MGRPDEVITAKKGDVTSDTLARFLSSSPGPGNSPVSGQNQQLASAAPGSSAALPAIFPS
jgi:hypothetical protein